MGGCCCCSSRSAGSERAPTYFYCPRDLEEHEPLSSNNHGALSAVSSGLLVDTNLDTSTPDTYQAPPAPLPYDMGLASSQTSPRDVEYCRTKSDQTQLANSHTTTEANDCFETSDCKNKTDCEHNSPKIIEDEVNKPISTSDVEDVCPICLEAGTCHINWCVVFDKGPVPVQMVSYQTDYDADNPRIVTKCEHHFHLSCILEWMERSDTCAICDQIMMIDNMYGMVSPEQSF